MKKEIKYIRNKEEEKWIKELENQLIEVQTNLKIANFINGVNKIEEYIEKNPELKSIRLRIKGITGDNVDEIEKKITYTRLEDGICVDDNKIRKLIRIIKDQLPDLNNFTSNEINLNESKEIIREKMSNIFLVGEEKSKYTFLLMSAELEEKKETIKKNKI